MSAFLGRRRGPVLSSGISVTQESWDPSRATGLPLVATEWDALSRGPPGTAGVLSVVRPGHEVSAAVWRGLRSPRASTVSRTPRRHRRLGSGGHRPRLSLTAWTGSQAKSFAEGGRGARGPQQGQAAATRSEGPAFGRQREPASSLLVGCLPVSRSGGARLRHPRSSPPPPQGAHRPWGRSETHDRRPVFFLKYISCYPPQASAKPLGVPSVPPGSGASGSGVRPCAARAFESAGRCT